MCRISKRGMRIAEGIIALVVVMLAILMPNNEMRSVCADNSWYHDSAGNLCDYFVFGYYWQTAPEPEYAETAVMKKVGVFTEGYIAPGETLATVSSSYNGGFNPTFTGTFWGSSNNATVKSASIMNIGKYATMTEYNCYCDYGKLGVLGMVDEYDYSIAGREVDSITPFLIDIWTFNKGAYYRVSGRNTTGEVYIEFYGNEDPVAPRHECNYEWSTVREATEYEDGEEVLQCSICGKVIAREYTSGCSVLIRNILSKIANAPANGTVTIDTTYLTCYPKVVLDALAARPDVTLVTNYTYDHVNYKMTIPAGSSQISGVVDDNGFAGFRRIERYFPTTVR